MLIGLLLSGEAAPAMTSAQKGGEHGGGGGGGGTVSRHGYAADTVFLENSQKSTNIKMEIVTPC
jgi:hypothetical protein